MKAVIINRYGNLDVLEQKEVNAPKPGQGEILIEVHACGLNPVDFKIRQGHLKELFPVTFPRILGSDISGVVKELGPDANDFQVGDQVYFSNSLDRDGGYAEFSVADQKLVAKKPRTLSFVDAASLPVVGLTSIQALRDFGGIRKGMRVLIHAGAGGVGSFAIQYAKSVGATVYSTASSEKRDYVRSLGADRIIDYRTEDFLKVCEEEGRMDIVFDTIGGVNYAKNILATKEGGAVPCIVNPPDNDTKALSEKHRVKTDFFLLQGNRPDLNLISSLIERGVVRTSISTVLSLEDVRQGHSLLESGRTQGKIVLRIRASTP